MKLLEMDLEAIFTTSWWVTQYIFTSLVAENRTGFSIFLGKITNIAPTLLPPIAGDALPPLITWKKGWSGTNPPRLASVGESSPLLFYRIINQLM